MTELGRHCGQGGAEDHIQVTVHARNTRSISAYQRAVSRTERDTTPSTDTDSGRSNSSLTPPGGAPSRAMILRVST